MLTAGMLGSSALAQTQAQQDRIDRVSRLVATAPMCEHLGMTVSPDLPTRVAEAFKNETAGWALGAQRVEQLAVVSADRQSKVLKRDLDTASATAKSDAQLRNLKTVLLGYARTCVEATEDPIFADSIKKPAGFTAEAAATESADSMLEDGGLASWQTPVIQARGSLMMLAGTCRSIIGKARSDALVSAYGKSEDPRTRGYYMKSFDLGLDDTESKFDLAQCNRAIRSFKADVVKADVR